VYAFGIGCQGNRADRFHIALPAAVEINDGQEKNIPRAAVDLALAYQNAAGVARARGWGVDGGNSERHGAAAATRAKIAGIAQTAGVAVPLHNHKAGHFLLPSFERTAGGAAGCRQQGESGESA
jgi:hypothetical protein